MGKVKIIINSKKKSTFDFCIHFVIGFTYTAIIAITDDR